MRIAYLDCFAGVSGDMVLGALVDAGHPLPALRKALRAVDLPPFRLKAERVSRNGIAATLLYVVTAGKPPARGWRDLDRLLAKSGLASSVKSRSREVLRRLGEAEAKVHGIPIEKVHFHEVGAVDTLVDVVGTVAALESLGIRKVFASTVNVGSGTMEGSHGLHPVPAPATMELLKGVPVRGSSPSVETATPTGAALLAALAEGFGPMPPMSVASIGYGAGSRDVRERPNVLRVLIGETIRSEGSETVVKIETNIDDMDPRLYENVLHACFAAGALDVWLTPIQMKKGRPGILLSALAPEPRAESVAGTILRETTSLGVRMAPMQRQMLARRTQEVRTRFGDVRVKLGMDGGAVVTAQPEYEDVNRLAARRGVPAKEVLSAAQAAARRMIDEE
ncbi:MAG: nickel pincer cofactor biosynthesis protein LarC [Nitrospirae bacterium]|nr:nickel pincer cofactor biosynthesis protein LarC [Nitrospirota bacterium]